MIEGFYNLSYSQRLNNCKILSMKDRRERSDLIEVFKIINGHSDIDHQKLFTMQVQEYYTRNHSKPLKNA